MKKPIWFVGSEREWRMCESISSDLEAHELFLAEERVGSSSSPIKMGLRLSAWLGSMFGAGTVAYGIAVTVAPALMIPAIIGAGTTAGNFLYFMKIDEKVSRIGESIAKRVNSKRIKNTWHEVEAKRESMGKERVEALSESVKAALGVLKKSKDGGIAGGDTSIAERTLKALTFVHEARDERTDAEREYDDVVAEAKEMADQIMKSHNERKVTKDILKRLLDLGEIGSEGVAALKKARAAVLEWADGTGRRECESISEEILPRLLSAFEKVPFEEREKVSEKLGGISAIESLKRGLKAAHQRIDELYEVEIERSRLATEQEARVLEERVSIGAVKNKQKIG